MPAYVATHTLRYDAGAGATDFNWVAGTVTDNGDDIWTSGETLDDGSSSIAFGTPSYSGFVQVNGTDYPVITDSLDGDYIILFDNEADRDAGSALFPTRGDVDAALNTGSFTACFMAGTGIATPKGDVAVDELKIGDTILTDDGTETRVKWVGVQNVLTAFQPAERLMPVRFAAGSLGAGVPHADLTVTADHAMLIDGVLCQGSALVNGSTITRVPLDEIGPRYAVYHVETDAHEIILANGAAAETFIDNVSRRNFSNFAEYAALYGEEAEMQELPLPRVLSARQLPAAIRAKLGLSDAA